MTLSYIRLLVDNFDECFTFYSEILGFKVTWGKPGDSYASFSVNSHTALSIFISELMYKQLNIPLVETTGNPRQVICFETFDVDSKYQKLLAAGVEFINKPATIPGWGIRCVHCYDPAGNILEINQLLPQELWAEDLVTNKPDDYK